MHVIKQHMDGDHQKIYDPVTITWHESPMGLPATVATVRSQMAMSTQVQQWLLLLLAAAQAKS